MNKKYCVKLAPQQRQRLEELIRIGNLPARVQTHARILLKADCSEAGPNWTDEQIAEGCEVSRPTVERVRRTFVTRGFDAALHRKKWTGPSRRKLDGTQEAHLVAITCGDPPDGYERWTLSLLADKLVELDIVTSITPETVRRVLKKTNLSLG
jgi:transposase